MMSDNISRQAVLNYPIRLDHYDEEHGNRDFVLGIESVMEYVESLPSAEPKTGECKTCKRSSDYCWSIGENDTRCPIEEHYALPKDGYCHLYEPYREETDDESTL